MLGFLLLIPFSRNIIFKIILKSKMNNKEQIKKDKTIDGEIVTKDKDEL